MFAIIIFGVKMRIAIIGTGNVGKNLGAALENSNEVVYGSRDPTQQRRN